MVKINKEDKIPKTVLYKGKIYNIRFKHDRIIDPLTSDITAKGGTTTAYIKDENKNLLFSAVAECSKRDAYVKSLGRKISAGRLIKNIDDEEVKEFKKNYIEVGKD